LEVLGCHNRILTRIGHRRTRDHVQWPHPETRDK
jgi:hypothetical protein